MKANAANKYFSGRYAEAAQAIDNHDADRLLTVSKDLDLNAPGREQMTLLWYAIQKKDYRAIQILVREGSRVDRQAVENLGTPLQFALMDKDLRLLEAMLDGGLSPDWQNEDGANLLQLAMKSDHAFDVVKLLVARHANLNARDSIGGSALDEAVDTMQPEIASYLIEHGANATGHMNNGSSTAWAVQQTIARLNPAAEGASTTDFSMGKSGQPVATKQTQPAPGTTPEGQQLLHKYEQLRALMIAKGAKFPADSPAKVREQMSKK
ncbi:ankyrin repeat domain-containing protein [Burkholderia pseudomultivorans]|uniref:Ankryin n=1 Tax=Burkholderia pseudomultivorans TaxID=1207504 RepID=A0A132ECQ9_9BURK|nr:ankyrin repeat domain-containing protein [Burkholderia pseudomultivorans]KWF23886.1 ankryin [Burkholderia pseudomultivorans]